MRPVVVVIACAALVALGVVALASDGSEEPKSAAKEGDRPAKAPAPLAKLYDQGNELLDGGVDAYKAQLHALRGYPVVVNKWASWCGPCRAEFPFFQSQALKRGSEIAFIGIDAQDNDADAHEFLEEFPTPYPSYKDPDLKISAEIKAVQGFPSTVFYDSKGEVAYIHVGGYATEAKLAEDIERYAN
jgi:cytochrome c biogenesis protein CcmG, thiol:disulfide interchange protein DsbE